MRRIRAAVAAVGAGSLLAQVALLREFLALSQGNELVVGVVFGTWLCLTAGATALGARPAWPAARARRTLCLLLGLAPLLCLGGFASTILARPDTLGAPPSPLVILATALAALGPTCAIGGLAFAWAVQAAAEREPTAIYVADTAGAALAGLLFHLLLADGIRAAWVVLAAGLCCTVGAITLGWSRGAWKSLALPIAAFALAAGLAPALCSAVESDGFPGQHLLVLRSSRYGQLAVSARGGQRAFSEDGVLLFTNEDQLAAEEAVHLPLLLHPSPRRLLLLGGGLGGGLVEALKHRPERVDYAEIDADLLGLAAQLGSAETRAALGDPRVHLLPVDGRSVLRQAARPYDLILIHAPIPQNALVARYSTVECFREARRALAPGGLLAVTTPGSDTRLGEAERRRHASLVNALTSAFPFTGGAPGSQTILWAAERPVDARPTELVARLEQRGLRLAQVGPTWLFDRLLPMHLARYRREIGDNSPVENRDFRPVVYLFGLLESLQRIAPGPAKHLLALSSQPWSAPWAWVTAVSLVAGLALLSWAMRRMGRRRGAPGLAVAAAGATGMALQIALVMAYQFLRGHLFHALGLLLAGSMAGLAMGALAATRLARRISLSRALAGVALLALAVAGALNLAPAAPNAVAAATIPLLVLVGAGTGFVYPVAVRASARSEAPARMYAWDLVGAAVAALLTSLIAIPVLGLVAVALLCAALCVMAALANRGRAPST